MTELANFDPSLAINPSSAQVAAFLALDPARPVVFVNLHRYRARAQYPAGYAPPGLALDVSGREAYHRYLSVVESRYLPQVGARFLIVAPVDVVMIGAGDWHEVVIGRYPTREAAVTMPGLPGYADIAVHRIAAMEAALTLALPEAALTRLGGG